jgi:hypothetical protein
MSRYLQLIIAAAAIVLAGCANEEDTPDRQGVQLRWESPSEYDDGVDLAVDAVVEYRIYVDQEMVQRIDQGITEYFLELPAGEWMVTISSVVNGVESRMSDPLEVVIENEDADE